MGAKYVECSSKEMRGVDEVFGSAVDAVVGVEQQGSSSRGATGAGAGGGDSGGTRKKIRKRTCKLL